MKSVLRQELVRRRVGRRGRIAVWGPIFIVCFGVLLCSTFVSTAQPEKSEADRRATAQRLTKDGNDKEAFDVYESLVLDPASEPTRVGEDLSQAYHCLRQLNRVNETDALIEKAVVVHSGNWRFLHQTANLLAFSIQHDGYLIAGEFERGQHRGGGEWVGCFERDRVRALQLMVQAMNPTEATEADAGSRRIPGNEAQFYYDLARILGMGRSGNLDAWRLQTLTDFSELPDYEKGYQGYYWRGRGGSSRGAPVDEEGNPVYHLLPESWESAKTDGERWRWALVEAAEVGGEHWTYVIRNEFANFLRDQFGVQTMASYGALWGRGETESGDAQAGSSPWEVSTLADNETMARLATGVKRWELPDELNFVGIYTDLTRASEPHFRRQAFEALAGVYENRRQYEKAAEAWREVIALYDEAGDKNGVERSRNRLDQIVENWGQFEPVTTFPAGEAATVDFRFRNGDRVEFEARAIKVAELLADVKDLIKSRPNKLEWEQININDIGRRLVWNEEKKYVGDKIASWSLDLDPLPRHFDRRITVSTPLDEPGAYLVTARMADGNTSRIVLWLDDTAIVKKPLAENRLLVYVADSRAGKPLTKANVEFFGYWHKHIERHRYETEIKHFAEFTDEDGKIVLGRDRLPDNHNWLITATTPEGRYSYLGFTGVWFPHYHDQEYNETKVFGIADRPVYRPDQKVQFKVWVRHAKYDRDEASDFANQTFALIIHNPKGDKVLEETFAADAYGGFDGEYSLPADATLGMYSIQVNDQWAPVTFRVEEYKKPEFEVTVKAPTEPVMLGEKIPVKIEAKYYFGAPVTKAKVKYTVNRTNYDAQWYPIGLWDWFYGPGYWWFGYDYVWYPGWAMWHSCIRPMPWWWQQPSGPPEVVAENEVEIGADGTVEFEIDTSFAKAVHGDVDHRYAVSVEVVDMSRRTITGSGQILVARKPFKVYAWTDRGHYRTGDTIHASFDARTLDGKGVKGKGRLTLYRVTYDKEMKPREKKVRDWKLDTSDEGRARIQLTASDVGQYRLSYNVTDSKKHAIEGGYLFTVSGPDFDGSDFRFNALELIPDRREYKPGDKVRLMVNTNRKGATVLLFVRPANGVYLEPRVLDMKGKSAVQEIEVTKKDMPNFYVEAVTVFDGQVYTEAREIVVPPESRVLDMEVLPSKTEYRPGEKATVKVKLTGSDGEPFVGSTVMTVYDKAVEYISGGSNVADIREFFWKWRRRHQSQTENNLARRFGNLLRKKETAMRQIGVFGRLVVDDMDVSDLVEGEEAHFVGTRSLDDFKTKSAGFAMGGDVLMARELMPAPSSPAAMDVKEEIALEHVSASEAHAGPGAEVEPTVRTEFADTAFWIARLETDPNGEAEVSFDMPENLTGWKIRTWAMGHGTKVGQAEAEVVTKKNLLLRLQAPRFFVEKDEVVLSANVHNYLKNAKDVRAVLELDGECLEPMDGTERTVEIGPNGEERVDWRVRVVAEGEAVVRMKALTDEESDAMEMRFPAYVHGMDKMVSFSRHIPPDKESAEFVIDVPEDRRVETGRLEVRYSPTLAGAMVDALPYLVSYPYGCTEQTLSRFLPAVVTQKVLLDMGVDLEDVKTKIANLNAQEIGDDVERAKQWKRYGLRGHGPDRNPVFDQKEVERMVKEGVEALTEMQLSDGGWGWFSGYGERSWPHTTAYVVHGLQIAAQNDVALVPGVLDRGVEWLKRYQAEELRKLKNWEKDKGETKPYKQHADNLDAFVYMVLVDAGAPNDEMRERIYRDRNELAVYAKAMFGIAMHRQNRAEERDMIVRNIEQFLVRDDENQTAYLNLGNGGYWWYWYGSEYEAQGYYLKLLAVTGQTTDWRAPYLVKYLLNNRKHATYWNSTRDTAVVVEAFADYLRVSGEDKPDMTVEVLVDGKKRKEVRITPEELFTFDNRFLLVGNEVETGRHTIELRKKGTGPLYACAYLNYFSLEDFITSAGLEVKVQRNVYKLTRADKTVKVAGSRGQAVDQRVEKYDRTLLATDDVLKSGDLVEIELVIESKNDYEYLVFEDMKAAGFEPVDVRSGYTGNAMGAYVEFRDNRVAFLVRSLARGRHSVAYRTRAEIPGRYSALPAKGWAMYAPELRANSDEIQLRIED
ncbi:alpha-2-macroglobulin [Candidatus Sumerlaeota bacterium]|nr:alpha-2-macroglobulin [Candidatus Sumerlaeota bacterium]